MVQPSGELDFLTFLFPGVLAMSVLFSAAFAGISLVWDREFGFLREMLVAPVSKAAIVVGKCLGGATTETLQAVVLLALAGLVGVPYHPVLLLQLLFGAFMLTAMGVLLSARIKQIQTAMPASQLIIIPMMFLSGALFPLANLPGWLAVLTKLKPADLRGAANAGADLRPHRSRSVGPRSARPGHHLGRLERPHPAATRRRDRVHRPDRGRGGGTVLQHG